MVRSAMALFYTGSLQANSATQASDHSEQMGALRRNLGDKNYAVGLLKNALQEEVPGASLEAVFADAGSRRSISTGHGFNEPD